MQTLVESQMVQQRVHQPYLYGVVIGLCHLCTAALVEHIK